MMRKVILIVYLLSLLLVLGCQEEQKPVSLEAGSRLGLESQVVAGCCESCSRMLTIISPRDIAIARNPGIRQ